MYVIGQKKLNKKAKTSLPVIFIIFAIYFITIFELVKYDIVKNEFTGLFYFGGAILFVVILSITLPHVLKNHYKNTHKKKEYKLRNK
jgi:uncharacterized membrane protein